MAANERFVDLEDANDGSYLLSNGKHLWSIIIIHNHFYVLNKSDLAVKKSTLLAKNSG